MNARWLGLAVLFVVIIGALAFAGVVSAQDATYTVVYQYTNGAYIITGDDAPFPLEDYLEYFESCYAVGFSFEGEWQEFGGVLYPWNGTGYQSLACFNQIAPFPVVQAPAVTPRELPYGCEALTPADGVVYTRGDEQYCYALHEGYVVLVDVKPPGDPLGFTLSGYDTTGDEPVKTQYFDGYGAAPLPE